MQASLRSRVHAHLDPAHRAGKGLSRVNQALTLLIAISVLVAILETEPLLLDGHEGLFLFAEITLGAVFITEYVVRVWTSAEDPKYGPGLRGRLRYMASPIAIIDLLALAPLLFAFIGAEGFLLRIVRLLRIIRIARLGRFSAAMRTIGTAVASRQYELMVSFAVAGLVLLVSSTLLYVIEGEVQPNTFGSVPRAMWWSIITLTTVGYGDAFPVTPLGKSLAALTAMAGIGLIAMPTGILAAAFSEVMEAKRAERRKQELAQAQAPSAS